MSLEKFEEKNIPLIVDRVYDLWKPNSKNTEFNRIYVESIIRQNHAKNDQQFQITENDKLCAICFAEKKDETGIPTNWVQNQLQFFNIEEKEQFLKNLVYLEYMDKKTFSYMKKDDIKLSLFISIKKGKGNLILSEAISLFKNSGYKNMYLWTDCECNVDWYFKNGYKLIEKAIYLPYSTKNSDFLTYIFCLPL